VTENDLGSHVEDILNALKNDSSKEVTRAELEKELTKFMEYGVPIEQAKQTLIKKFGGVAVLSSGRKLISDLLPNERSVNLLCRVIAVNPKEITVKGDNRKIFYGILGDESGTISFTAWNSNLELEKGDVVEISNAYTREWQGSVQLNLGDRVRIEKTDKEKLPESAFKPREVKIKDLRSGIGAVDVTARILEVKEREATVGEETKKVFSGMIADETGKAQFTSWHDFKIKDGDVLRITGGYVKSWKGIPQLTFDDKATVKKVDKSKVPKKDLQSRKMSLFTLVEKRGALDIEAEGTVIEIRPGSGIITRCPECNRTIQDNQCGIHGKVNGKSDLRLKLVIDDGTGSVGSVLNKELTEKLLGKTIEECKKMSEDALAEKINKTLFARKISIQGNALGDEFGTSLIAKDVRFVDLDMEEEAEKLSKEVEELL
jgi:ssDNA-binding replication factor A large subunit